MAKDDNRDDGPILVVDDDPHLREALVCILEDEGHRVIQAADGPTAVRLAKRHAPDLMVVDDSMPGMTGERVIGELRRALQVDTPPALLISADPGPLNRVRSLGTVVGLEKPFNVPELLVAVERHRRRSSRDAS